MTLSVTADPILAVRTYLLGVPEVTAITDRIVTRLPKTPVWPTIRLTLINTYAVFERRYDRCLFQLDCFDDTDADAHLLARVVRAALIESGSHIVGNAVLGGATDTSIRPLPDETFTPPVPRFALSAHVFVRPHQQP